MDDEPREGELGPLISSPEFARMVDRFQSSTGLRLQVFDVDAQPLTPVEEYPRYCRMLQERKACPLYHDPKFLLREQEALGVCAAGVGHFVAPIRDENQMQLGAVVSPPVKFALNEVPPLAELAFRLKVFPDDLIQAADSIPSADGERLLSAGEMVSVGLNLLAEMQAKERVGAALRKLQSQIAEANAETLCQHLVDAVLYVTRADYALVMLMDDSGGDLATGFDQPRTDHLVEAKRRLLDGIAEWVRHADRTVTVPDISKSAWCRYLTGEAIDRGSVVSVPIPAGENGPSVGAIVVGYDVEREDVDEPMGALQAFTTEGLYAIVMGRKLIQAEQSALLDGQSGAYSGRYLDELLEREVSRASRYGHDLALVILDIQGFEVLRGKYGEGGLARVLREMVAVVRSKTRKVNVLARVQDGRFCLIVPEGTREVAARLADMLRRSLEEHPFSASGSGEIVRILVDSGIAATEKGRDDRATLMARLEQSLQQAREQRRIDSLKP